MQRHLIQRNSNPFSVFDQIEKDMNSLMDFWPSQVRSNSFAGFSPAYEVNDRGEHYMLSFDLPGLSKDDVSLEIKKDKLHVSGERKSEFKEGDYSEKRYGRFERIIALPEGVSDKDLEARFENGVLFIAIPKIGEKEVTQKIEIKEGAKEGIWNRLLGGIHKDKNSNQGQSENLNSVA